MTLGPRVNASLNSAPVSSFPILICAYSLFFLVAGEIHHSKPLRLSCEAALPVERRPPRPFSTSLATLDAIWTLTVRAPLKRGGRPLLSASTLVSKGFLTLFLWPLSECTGIWFDDTINKEFDDEAEAPVASTRWTTMKVNHKAKTVG
jgi:hypothetical protein